RIFIFMPPAIIFSLSVKLGCSSGLAAITSPIGRIASCIPQSLGNPLGSPGNHMPELIQALIAHPRDGAADTEAGHHLPPGIEDGNCHPPGTQVDVLIADRIAPLSYGSQFPPEIFSIVDGVGGK